MFQVRERKLELRLRSPESVPVDGRWINRTGLVAEGLAFQPYLHLDIRTPFGETVEERHVAEALAEALGPKRERYRMAGWHVLFVEDTNLGSNHRVFVDLEDATADGEAGEGMDARLSLELALEALGDLAADAKGVADFQLILGGPEACYSLLYLNGSPFHVLRVPGAAGADTAQRLRRHREFAPGRAGGVPLRTFLAKADPLREYLDAGDWPAEELSLPGAEAGGMELLHLGLARAAGAREFAAHNRVPAPGRRRNASIRARFRFYLAAALCSMAGALAAGGYAAAIRHFEREAGALRAQASAYQTQVDAIRSLRVRKAGLKGSLSDLRPIWAGPVDWSSALDVLDRALPKEGGIDDFTAVRGPDGAMEISFKAWVRDWNQVQAIQKRLAASGRFARIELSEQRKDLPTGVVVFRVKARLGGA